MASANRCQTCSATLQPGFSREEVNNIVREYSKKFGNEFKIEEALTLLDAIRKRQTNKAEKINKPYHFGALEAILMSIENQDEMDRKTEEQSDDEDETVVGDRSVIIDIETEDEYGTPMKFDDGKSGPQSTRKIPLKSLENKVEKKEEETKNSISFKESVRPKVRTENTTNMVPNSRTSGISSNPANTTTRKPVCRFYKKNSCIYGKTGKKR